jgi:hypothetical protein
LRFAAEAERSRYLTIVTLALEVALLMPLTSLCARVARIGADGGAIVAPNRIAAYAGFETAKMLDKLVIAALYFLKTVAFGFLVGLALFGAVLVGAIVSARSGDGSIETLDNHDTGVARASTANQP